MRMHAQIGGMVLHEGRVAEMQTGEGKTLVATLPAYLNALTGRGVHIVTVNDYPAKRDASGARTCTPVHAHAMPCGLRGRMHSRVLGTVKLQPFGAAHDYSSVTSGVLVCSYAFLQCACADQEQISCCRMPCRGCRQVGERLPGALQKSEVAIDACLPGKADFTFLQQAAHLTGGVHSKPKHWGALLAVPAGEASLPSPLSSAYKVAPCMHGAWHCIELQDVAGVLPDDHHTMLTCPALTGLVRTLSERGASLFWRCCGAQTAYAGDGFSRGFLELPRQMGVDFRATCFCHRVCLSCLPCLHVHAVPVHGHR
jgi:hypothetical protein